MQMIMTMIVVHSLGRSILRDVFCPTNVVIRRVHKPCMSRQGHQISIYLAPLRNVHSQYFTLRFHQSQPLLNLTLNFMNCVWLRLHTKLNSTSLVMLLWMWQPIFLNATWIIPPKFQQRFQTQSTLILKISASRSILQTSLLLEPIYWMWLQATKNSRSNSRSRDSLCWLPRSYRTRLSKLEATWKVSPLSSSPPLEITRCKSPVHRFPRRTANWNWNYPIYSSFFRSNESSNLIFHKNLFLTS